LGAVEHDTAWRIALVIASGVVAFFSTAVLLKPRGRPFAPFALAETSVFWTAFAGDLAPYIFAAFHRDPDASTPVTVALYVLAVVAAVLLARKGFGRAVLAAAAAVVIRWPLSLAAADIYSRMTH
jgi:hypothetical protein